MTMTARERLHALSENRFVRFLFVGGLNTLFGYGVFAGLILLHVWYPVAAAIATVLGILFNFKTTGALVFRSHDSSLIFRFLLVYGISYAVGVLVLRVTNELGLPILLVSGAMLLPMAVFSYTLQRILVFRSGPKPSGEDGAPGRSRG